MRPVQTCRRAVQPLARSLANSRQSTPLAARRADIVYRSQSVSPARRYASAAVQASTSEHDSLPEVRPQPVSRLLGYDQAEQVVSAAIELLRRKVGGDSAWTQRLENALQDLSAPRRRKIAVVGDRLAAPEVFISAVVQDAIADTPACRSALLYRHQDSSSPRLLITTGASACRSPDRLALPSSWLQSSDSDLLELKHTSDRDLLDAALSADGLVILVDPYRLASSDAIESCRPILSSGRPVIAVVNGKLPADTTMEDLKATLDRSIGRPDSPLSVHFTDASLALQAHDALHHGLQRPDATPSTRSKAFEAFQHAYLQSGIGPVQISMTTLARVKEYQIQTALDTAFLALCSISTAVSRDHEALDFANDTIARLRNVSARSVSAAKATSVIGYTVEGGIVEGGVDAEMARARDDIQERFHRQASWIKLLAKMRVDNVGDDMATYIAHSFGADLEKQIVFETGRLSLLQDSLNSEVDETVRALSAVSISSEAHPLASPVLRNHLSTLSLAVPDLQPTTLLEPLYRRRRQMIEVCANNLQLDARTAMLQTLGVGFVGAFASWWLCVPPLAAFNPATAVGLGSLSIVGALVLGQRQWSKAQSNFWREWKRSTCLLKGDLQAAYASVITSRVVAKVHAAADGLERLVRIRRDSLVSLEADVTRLQGRLRESEVQSVGTER